MPIKEMEIGEKRNKLKYLGFIKIKKGIGAIGNFECDCGEKKEIRIADVRANKYKSCGCLLKKHGKSETKIYDIYYHMIDRCYNDKTDSYKYYGARGIKVCDRWLESFENFYEDMGDRPSVDHQIDRINNDGNYDPYNCKWVTRSENCINRRCKSNKTGHKNIKVTDYGAYRARVVRQGYERLSLTHTDINEVLYLRDEYIKEYKNDPTQWIKDTVENNYDK